MSRPLRIEIPDGVYHVTNRGLERREIVRDGRDRHKWHELLDREVPAARGLRLHLTVEAVDAAVCRAFGEEADRLRQRRRRGSEARGVALYLSRKWTGQPVTALAAHYGGISGQAVSALVTRVAQRLEEDRSLGRKVRDCEQALGLML